MYTQRKRYVWCDEQQEEVAVLISRNGNKIFILITFKSLNLNHKCLIKILRKYLSSEKIFNLKR